MSPATTDPAVPGTDVLATVTNRGGVVAAVEPFDAVRAVLPKGSAPRRGTGAFPVDVLSKRLLSCPTAFPQPPSRARPRLSTAETASEDVAAAEPTHRHDIADDHEIQQREAHRRDRCRRVAPALCRRAGRTGP